MISSNKTNYINSAVLGLLLICCLQSFAFAQRDNTLYNPSIGWIYNFIIVGSALFVLFRSIGTIKVDGSIILVITSVFIYFFYNLIHLYGRGNINSLLEPIVLTIFCLTSNNQKKNAFEALKLLFVCMSVYGIVVFILYLIGILPPFSVVDFYEEYETPTSYGNYIFSYIEIPLIGIPKLCGLFNEPGFFGTVGALILIADRFKMSKENIVILVACFFSTSLAFFVLVMIYYLFRLLSVFKFKSFVLLVLLAIVLVYLTTLESDNELFKATFGRLLFEDGSFVGDNRVQGDMDAIWREVINDPNKFLFGLGRYLEATGSSSYKILIVRHGLVGVLIIFTPLLLALWSLCKKNKDCAALAICFIASIYQRPSIFYLLYFVLLLGGIQYIKYSSFNDKKINQELESALIK